MKESLQKMREPFKPNQIGKLPKPTKAQTDSVKADYRTGIRCTICGTWHHKDVIHLDYLGHAALTDRLLDVDPEWNWEPLALDDKGFPAIDSNGGMWIKLTVCGVTRLGYGDAQGKTGGDAMKERIGDALRNAGMRFGAALDLWHKGELHVDEEQEAKTEKQTKAKTDVNPLQPKIDELKKLASDEPVDIDCIREAWRSLDSHKQQIVWKMLNTKEHAAIRHATQGAAA